MLIANISPAANAQVPDTGPITLCVARNGKIVGINIHCQPHNFQLVWNLPGPAGVAGEQGIVGPTGPTGAPGPMGVQGNVGVVGPTGLMGALGVTGPDGEQGMIGPTGPTGNVGFPGPTGPTGALGMQGPSGTPTFPFPSGDNVELLSGGTLGGTIGGNAGIQLTDNSGSGGFPTFPLYMGPGNGASGQGIGFPFSNPPDTPPFPIAGPQTSVQVPMPGGTAFNMTVAIAPTDAGPVGAEYTFIICNGNDCDIPANPFCRVHHMPFPSPDTTKCSTNTYPGSPLSLDFLPGDTLSIQAYSSEANPTNTVDVNWSMDFAIAPTSAQ